MLKIQSNPLCSRSLATHTELCLVAWVLLPLLFKTSPKEAHPSPFVAPVSTTPRALDSPDCFPKELCCALRRRACGHSSRVQWLFQNVLMQHVVHKALHTGC